MPRKKNNSNHQKSKYIPQRTEPPNTLVSLVECLPPRCLDNLKALGITKENVIRLTSSRMDNIFTQLNCSFNNCELIISLIQPYVVENPYLKDMVVFQTAASFVNGYEYMQHIIFTLNKRISKTTSIQALNFNMLRERELSHPQLTRNTSNTTNMTNTFNTTQHQPPPLSLPPDVLSSNASIPMTSTVSPQNQPNSSNISNPSNVESSMNSTNPTNMTKTNQSSNETNALSQPKNILGTGNQVHPNFFKTLHPLFCVQKVEAVSKPGMMVTVMLQDETFLRSITANGIDAVESITIDNVVRRFNRDGSGYIIPIKLTPGRHTVMAQFSVVIFTATAPSL